MQIIYLLLLCILVLAVCNCKLFKRKKVQNVKKINMYGRDSCGYTLKMKKEIKQAGKWSMFKYIDVTTPEGKISFDKLNIDGVPAFEHKSKIVVGAMPVEILLKKFNV